LEEEFRTTYNISTVEILTTIQKRKFAKLLKNTCLAIDTSTEKASFIIRGDKILALFEVE